MKNPILLFKGLFKIDESPDVIAKGFALGSFIGMIPIPGFQVFVAFTIAKIMNLNKTAACVAVFNTNIFTGLFIFAFNYWLGKKILGVTSNFEMPKELNLQFAATILKAGSDVYLSLLIGGIVTGLISALVAYYLIKNIIQKKQLKR